jgi:hypothetical protein
MGSRISVDVTCECPFRSVEADFLRVCNVLVLEREGDPTCVGLEDEGCPLYGDEIVVEKALKREVSVEEQLAETLSEKVAKDIETQVIDELLEGSKK